MHFPREPLLPSTSRVHDKDASFPTMPVLILLLVIGILVFYWAPGHDLDKAIVKKLDQELQDPHPMQHRTQYEAWSQIEKEELLLKKKSMDANADASDNVDADMYADADANADVDEGPLLNTETVKVAPEGMYALNAENIEGVLQPLAEHAGNVSIVVNVASYCGYTDSNYKGLEKLYQKYKSQGLVVLAFPCNQFGGQEPKPNEEIKAFAASMYNVTFPIFAKVDVNGENTHPVYSFLKQHLPTESGGSGLGSQDLSIQWNFEKFLVDRHGYPRKLVASEFDEQSLEADLLPLLTSRT